MLKQPFPQLCPAPLSYALDPSFISDSSNPAPSGAGVCSQCMAVSFLLCSAPSSSHFCDPAWTLHKLQGWYQFFHGTCLSLMSVFSLWFLIPFFASSSLCLAFYEFFKICFNGGVISLADMFTCVLLWVHWSWLHLDVSGTEQALILPTGDPLQPQLDITLPRDGKYSKILIM